MPDARLRVIWPFLLLSACFGGLGAATAVWMFWQHASVSESLRESVASQRAATELEECLLDVIALLRGRVESVQPLHGRLRRHLHALSSHADQPAERAISSKLEEGLVEYERRWREMPPPGKPGHEEAVRAAAEVLEKELVKPCQEFQAYNTGRIRDAAAEHRRVLDWLGWGLIGVGAMGAAMGLGLGLAFQRGLSNSIRRLAVQIRDAASPLSSRSQKSEVIVSEVRSQKSEDGRPLATGLWPLASSEPIGPDVVVTEEGDFEGLHGQVEQLSRRIEAVVRELQQRQQEVLRAEQLAAVGQLAAGVAHELRNPLASIKLLVEAGLEEGALPAVDLKVIDEEVRRMNQGLQTFIDFARPPAPRRQPTSLKELVNHVCGLVRGRAAKQGVAVHADLPAEEALIVADGQQLEQVLINLVLNALDAMPQGGELRATARLGPGGAALEVADTGPGLSPEARERLFQPFYSGKPTGLGLGLVISRRIVDDHGGTITAANRPEGGAVFTVLLPSGGQGGRVVG